MKTSDIEAIDRVTAEMYNVAKDHGFHDNDGDQITVERIGVFIVNLHGECSELWEAARKGKLTALCDKGVTLTNAEEELADIVIRAMDTAHSLGISLGTAIAAKSAYNRNRPFMHGKKA